MFILALRAGQHSRIGRMEFWVMGSFPCRQTSDMWPQLPGFYRRSWQPEESTFPRHCQVPHTEIRGFPCFNRDFLNETIASARFSVEEAPVGSRAVLGWFLCFPEGSEHGAMAPQTRGARSSFAMSQVKKQCGRARYIDGPLLWHLDLV